MGDGKLFHVGSVFVIHGTGDDKLDGTQVMVFPATILPEGATYRFEMGREGEFNVRVLLGDGDKSMGEMSLVAYSLGCSTRVPKPCIKVPDGAGGWMCIPL